MVAGMDARRGLFDEFAISMAVLTRLPVGVAGHDEPGAIGASGWAFPLVGAGIGGVVAVAFFVAEALGCGSAVAAGLAVLTAVALTAAVIGIATALAALGPSRGAITLLLAAAGIALMAMLARRQIVGYTGDVLGAFQQIGEIVMLLVAAAK